jgi:hypothetical protein
LDEMQEERRPWISVTPTITEPIEFIDFGDSKGISVIVRPISKNYGASPATNIRVSYRVTPDLGYISPHEYRVAATLELNVEQAGLCNAARKAADADETGGISIFPGDTKVPPSGGASYSVAQWQDVIIVVNGCIDYTYGKKHGQTGFRMLLDQIVNGRLQGLAFIPGTEHMRDFIAPPGISMPSPTVARVPPSEFEFRADPAGGNYAK